MEENMIQEILTGPFSALVLAVTLLMGLYKLAAKYVPKVIEKHLEQMDEQRLAQSTAPRLQVDGHAELGTTHAIAIQRVAQLRHRDQTAATVAHPKHGGVLEAPRLDTGNDVLVGGGVAKAQIAVLCGQSQQVPNHRLTMAGTELANQ